MGNFRIEIEATGGHGDARDLKQGETLDPTAYPNYSVDRVAWEAVESLKKNGASVISARLIHWPETPSEVIDDVLNSKRLHGSF